MKALVFGATGLIGASLVERLLKEGSQVTGVSRGKIKKRFSSKKYHYISLDISNNKEFSKIRGKFDVVFNLAAHIATGYTTEDAKKCILIEKAQKNDNIFLFGDGSRSQDYVYVDDVVEANILAAKKNIAGTFNIGSGR